MKVAGFDALQSDFRSKGKKKRYLEGRGLSKWVISRLISTLKGP